MAVSGWVPWEADSELNLIQDIIKENFGIKIYGRKEKEAELEREETDASPVRNQLSSKRILVLKMPPCPQEYPKLDRDARLFIPWHCLVIGYGPFWEGTHLFAEETISEELIAFPEVRVTNPSLNRNLGSISRCALQLKPIRAPAGPFQRQPPNFTSFTEKL